MTHDLWRTLGTVPVIALCWWSKPRARIAASSTATESLSSPSWSKLRFQFYHSYKFTLLKISHKKTITSGDSSIYSVEYHAGHQASDSHDHGFYSWMGTPAQQLKASCLHAWASVKQHIISGIGQTAVMPCGWKCDKASGWNCFLTVHQHILCYVVQYVVPYNAITLQ